MKKIFALMLILCALFAFTACNKECDEHVDESPVDGVCDQCGAEIAPVEPGGLPLVPVW